MLKLFIIRKETYYAIDWFKFKPLTYKLYHSTVYEDWYSLDSIIEEKTQRCKELYVPKIVVDFFQKGWINKFRI